MDLDPADILSGIHPTRAASLGAKRRKKSIIGTGLEVSKLKHFKSFVESKILSKSDRTLVGAGGGGADGGGGGSSGRVATDSSNLLLRRRGVPTSTSGSSLATAANAKDNFLRRSSRTSFTDFDPSAPTVSDRVQKQHELLAFSLGLSCLLLLRYLYVRRG